VNQLVEQLDRRGFIAMNARRQEQIGSVVLSLGRSDFQRTLGQPAQTHAFDGQLSLFGGFATRQGQFKQFAEGEHGLIPA